MPLDSLVRAVNEIQTTNSGPILTAATGAGTVNCVWGPWNVQFIQTGTSTTTYTATNATNDSWVVWNQQMAHELQRAVNAASAAMTSVGYAVTNTITDATSALSNSSIWTIWNQTISTISTTNTWTVWNEQLRNANPQQVRQAVERRRPSEEEVRANLEREKTWREAEEKRKREEEEAKAKAEILLRRHLSPEQQEDLDKKNCFFLHIGEERYQIVRGQHGNVKLLDEDGKIKRSFCIHPKVKVPDADAMLAQKFLLETDKDAFYKIANITEYGGRGGALPPAANANR